MTHMIYAFVIAVICIALVLTWWWRRGASVNTWTVVNDKVHDGDELFAEIRPISYTDARELCEKNSQCKSFAFWDEDPITKKGKAALKTAAKNDKYRAAKGSYTHILQRGGS